MIQGIPSAPCFHELQEQSKSTVESVPLMIHLGLFIAVFSQADALLLFFPRDVLALYKYSEPSRREVLPFSVLKKGV